MLYTPPVTPWESVIPEVGSLTFKEGAAQGRTGDWGEVVTRYPYENVGMDHLLSMELLLIEKQPYETFGDSTFDCEKVSWKATMTVLLGFERLFSQILFFEN